MRKASFGLLAAVFVVQGPLAHAAFAGQIAPHSLRYQLTLTSANADSGVTGASGTMTYELRDLCNAWSWDFHMDVELHAYGLVTKLTTTDAAWEAKDGLSYRFFQRSVSTPGDSVATDGRARLDGPGLAGAAEFTSGAPAMALSAGTIFPMQALQLLLQQAADGDGFFYRTIFQGDDEVGTYDASAAILAPSVDEGVAAAAPGLAGQESWPVSVAYFYDGEDAASMEVEMRLYPQGVALYRQLDFGSFVLRAEPLEVEVQPAPEC